MIAESSAADLQSLDGKHLVITGGTGFVGTWMVESALCAQRHLGIDFRITVPTRDPAAFLARHPHLTDETNLRLVAADIRTPLDAIDRADAIVHAATEASASLNETNPAEMLDVIIAGMSNVLSFAARSGEIPFLFTSSGAVYGRQPTDMSHVPEDYTGAPDVLDPLSAYHEGKRIAELLGTIAASRSGLRFVPARLFAFLGPLLPLDAHFAAGNFLGDALAGHPIRIAGDGTPRRSYLHPIDMSTWLWAMLVRGQNARAYNVGSEDDVSIAELATCISAAAGGVDVEIAQTAVPGAAHARYVPSTLRARRELGLEQQIGLSEAVSRTIAWHLAEMHQSSPERQ